MNRWTAGTLFRWMDGRMNIQPDGCMDGWQGEETNVLMYIWMDGCIDGCMLERMGSWMDGLMDRGVDGCS